jgi:Meiotically Up-regulated Gene 113 (MUG113) protein
VGGCLLEKKLAAKTVSDIELVATYELFNINRTKLEHMIHRVFGPARLDIEIKDRFGNPVVLREWFLVPLFVINEAVERIKNGTITEYNYDPKIASLIRADKEDRQAESK